LIRLVVDASVAAKWVLTEVHTEVTRRVLASAVLLAPDLIWAELGSMLWRRRRRGELSNADVHELMADLRALPIRSYMLAPLLQLALDMAMRIDHSIYDCLYLALAEREDCAVLTADRGFHRSIIGGGLDHRVVWIENLV
jgi:predicted nucleic acid-binding protein